MPGLLGESPGAHKGGEMSTKFTSVDECLAAIAEVTNTLPDEVRLAYQDSKQIHIGWPQDQDCTAFYVGERKFAISDFRDGKAIWDITPDGFMVRW
jgi:hypothetical protein